MHNLTAMEFPVLARSRGMRYVRCMGKRGPKARADRSTIRKEFKIMLNDRERRELQTAAAEDRKKLGPWLRDLAYERRARQIAAKKRKVKR